MTQRYVNPHEILVPPRWARCYASRLTRTCIERDGQIVPLLITSQVVGMRTYFTVADRVQAERLDALKLAQFETVLTEDEWEADDVH